jgi:hypothetical protein
VVVGQNDTDFIGAAAGRLTLGVEHVRLSSAVEVWGFKPLPRRCPSMAISSSQSKSGAGVYR